MINNLNYYFNQRSYGENKFILYHKWDKLIKSFIRGNNISEVLKELSNSIRWNKEDINIYPNFPYVEMFNYFLENVQTNENDALYAISIISFLSKYSEKFPIDIFANVHNVEIITDVIKISKKDVCNYLITLLSSIIHHENELVEVLIKKDFLKVMKSRLLITCSMMPNLLKEYFYYKKIDEEILDVIHKLFARFVSSNDKILILNTLNVIDDLIVSGIEIDLSFLYDALKNILCQRNHMCVKALTCIIIKIPDFPFCFDLFYKAILKNHFNIIQPIMRMACKKYDEWNEFIAPKSIFYLLEDNVLEDLSYSEEFEIFRTFLIYQNDFNEYNTNVIIFLFKYISNTDICEKCLIALIKTISSNNLTNEQRLDLNEKIESNLFKIEELIVSDCDFVELASLFFDMYKKSKK